ncbi:Hypothetical predicted protein [Mytilus galloprovincialis]|uniref:Integrase catalytic domain-containing protein n=1 Tax=Mytilus galloprovincialis TaxID=29158 RepID=A0A8B6F0N4_MYTGA|nr:Hypothetical predicted protein [Mytilus galloprovincialis]
MGRYIRWIQQLMPFHMKIEHMPGVRHGNADAMSRLLHDARTGAHLGIKRTYEKAKLSPFYWRDMQGSIKLYIQQCEICGERESPMAKKRHQMKSYVVGVPFERVASDIAGPFPTSIKKNKYILVIGDYFSKLTEIYAMPDMRAETVADILFGAWVKRYGCPVEIHSDQGRQYESAVFRELCQLLEINKTRTTPLHPRSDGMIERVNRTVNDILSKYIKKHQKDWDEHLDYIDDNEEENFISEYVNKLEQKLREAHELARNNLKSDAKRQKNSFDAKVRPVVYNVGDYVWRNQKKNVPGIKLKIARYWTGSWVITEKLSDITFKVKCAENSPEVTVHGDILKPYLGSKKLVWFNQQNARPDMPDVPEQHPVEFPDLAKFTADVDDENSSVSENLQRIIGGKQICPPEIIPVSASDGENHSDTCPTNLGIPESGTRPARPSARIRNHMTISASTNTRTRTINKPKRFLDIYSLYKMPEVICSYCDLKYARRNLKRHINAVHNSNMRYVGCNESNCDRIFFRREYLLIHLQSTHKKTVEEAREMSRDAYLGYTPSENMETCGPQEKKLKRAEEENVPGPSSSEVPEVQEFVDEVILQEDASQFDIESAQKGACHSVLGGNTSEPDDIYNSDSNSSTCTTASNPDENHK